MAEKDQEFLEFVVKGLVEHPEAVKIGRTVDEMGVLLALDLHGDDMGKVIGRSGNTAKAIRTLLRVVGMKHNARVNLKINEPLGGSRVSQDSGGAVAQGWDGSHEAPATPAMKSVDDAMNDLGNF
jgi:predicted RNA-binding protein YlqC (UPF0109 family)